MDASESLQKSNKNISDKPLFAGRYDLLATIGSGMSAEVYVAEDTVLSRNVAIKRLRSSHNEDPKFLKLFETEAKVTANLNHPNILTIYDWGENDGIYLVTEYLTGGTLRGVLNAQRFLSFSQTVEVALQASRGIQVAHAAGLVHRDIKPANILFDELGLLRVADFGVARAVTEAAWTEHTGGFFGTMRYAAPEQHKTVSGDLEADPRTDIYALGLMMAEMLTGEVPLKGDQPIDTLQIRQSEDLDATNSMYFSLAPLLNKMCRADVTERIYADEVVAELSDAAKTIDPPKPLRLAKLNIEEADTPYVFSSSNSSPTETLTTKKSGNSLAPEVSTVVAGSNLSINNDLDDSGSESDGFLSSFFERRGLLYGVLAGLGLFALAGFLIFWFMRPDVVIVDSLMDELPQANLVGSYIDGDVSNAQKAADKNGWELVISRERFDNSVKDQVVKQNPEPNQPLKAGGRLALVVSEGLPVVVLPDLVGMSEDQALDRLAESELDLVLGDSVSLADEAKPVGEVLGYVVNGERFLGVDVNNVKAETGSDFALIVSSGPALRVVPVVKGKSVEAVRSELKSMGLNFTESQVFSDDVKSGLVVRTDPGVGVSVKRGDSINIYVSKGRGITIPDFKNREGATAAKEIEAMGLKVKLIDAGGVFVISQSPAPGTKLPPGGTVTITQGKP